jgi:hypothetical protein
MECHAASENRSATETSESIYQSTWCNIPEEFNIIVKHVEILIVYFYKKKLVQINPSLP